MNAARLKYKETTDIILDDPVKSGQAHSFVIPAEAGIQLYQLVAFFLDSGLHRSDDFLQDRQF